MWRAQLDPVNAHLPKLFITYRGLRLTEGDHRLRRRSDWRTARAADGGALEGGAPSASEVVGVDHLLRANGLVGVDGLLVMEGDAVAGDPARGPGQVSVLSAMASFGPAVGRCGGEGDLGRVQEVAPGDGEASADGVSTASVQ